MATDRVTLALLKRKLFRPLDHRTRCRSVFGANDDVKFFLPNEVAPVALQSESDIDAMRTPLSDVDLCDCFYPTEVDENDCLFCRCCGARENPKGSEK